MPDLGTLDIQVKADEQGIEAAHTEGGRKAAAEIMRGIEQGGAPRLRGSDSGGEGGGGTTLIAGGAGALRGAGGGLSGLARAGIIGAVIFGIVQAGRKLIDTFGDMRQALDEEIGRFSGVNGTFAGLQATNEIRQLRRDIQSGRARSGAAAFANRSDQQLRDRFQRFSDNLAIRRDAFLGLVERGLLALEGPLNAVVGFKRFVDPSFRALEAADQAMVRAAKSLDAIEKDQKTTATSTQRLSELTLDRALDQSGGNPNTIFARQAEILSGGEFDARDLGF